MRMKEENKVGRMLDVDIPGKRRRGGGKMRVIVREIWQRLKEDNATNRATFEEEDKKLYRRRRQMMGRRRRVEKDVQVHWLAVNYRIKFKLSTLTYRALLQYINHPIWLVSCTFLASPDNSDHLPHSSFLFLELYWTWASVLSLLLHPSFGINSQPHWNLVKVLPLSVKISKLISSKSLFHHSRRPLKLKTPVCTRILNIMINGFVLLRFWARPHEDLSAIEVILLLLLIYYRTQGIGKEQFNILPVKYMAC